MKLIFPEGPLQGVQILAPILQAILNAPGLNINPQFASISPDKIRLSPPYRGYSLTLEALAAGQGLKQATIGNWHYLVFANGEVLANAQVVETADKVEFSSLNYGPITTGTIAALNQAENNAHLQGKTFELRVLFISALHTVVIWLHAADEDVLIPITLPSGDVASPQLLDEASLLMQLTPAVQQIKSFVDADISGEQGD